MTARLVTLTADVLALLDQRAQDREARTAGDALGELLDLVHGPYPWPLMVTGRGTRKGER